MIDKGEIKKIVNELLGYIGKHDGVKWLWERIQEL
jgi:hypothetical protein